MAREKKQSSIRRGIVGILLLLLAALSTQSAQAQTRLIVRNQLGLPGINLTCVLSGCNVVRGLGDPEGQLFLVTFPPIVNPVLAILRLNLQTSILSVELDQLANTQDAYGGPAPSYLTDKTPTAYYGATVWRGYVTQPANALVRTAQAQSSFNVSGANVIVAVIDTGVDPNHPVLRNSLLTGYDFTRNANGGWENKDVSASPDQSHAESSEVNQRTVAVLDQRTVAVLDGNSQYAAFGHGTMTAGLVHLVAPQAKIMPLKAFYANGAGYNSDIIRAVYFGVKNGAQVLSMSFDYPSYSGELARAIRYANGRGVLSVASAGNDGRRTIVYPSGLPGVINVASTSNSDIQSTFTNYGAPPVSLAAPGEGIMTTYPWGTYAAGWGTSFSTPMVAGTAALMLGTNGRCNALNVAPGLKQAAFIADPDLAFKRLDVYRAVQSCRLLN
jgi:subtilisin family serine protease